MDYVHRGTEHQATLSTTENTYNFKDQGIVRTCQHDSNEDIVNQ